MAGEPLPIYTGNCFNRLTGRSSTMDAILELRATTSASVSCECTYIISRPLLVSTIPRHSLPAEEQICSFESQLGPYPLLCKKGSARLQLAMVSEDSCPHRRWKLPEEFYEVDQVNIWSRWCDSHSKWALDGYCNWRCTQIIRQPLDPSLLHREWNHVLHHNGKVT